MLRIPLLFMLMLILSACGAGPDTETLRQHISEQLTQRFGEERITLLTLERRGSQPASIRSQDGHIVYFKAALRLNEPDGLTSSDQQALSRLMSAGLEGLTIEGQDVIANGLSWNVWQEDHWRIRNLEPSIETAQANSSGSSQPVDPSCQPQVSQTGS